APLIVLFGAGLLAAISWLDDLRGLSPAMRLAAQFVAVGLGIIAAMPAGPVFQGWLMPGLDTLAAGLLWLWFVNLFNFMDGIDGLAGSEAAAIAIGLVLCSGFGAGRDPGLAVLAATTAAAMLGFLAWNWAPARIFLGDVGSVPLGYLLGFLLLSVAWSGYWRIALILPLYFLADATITLFRRLARGEAVWRPHLQHFYQRAGRRGAWCGGGLCAVAGGALRWSCATVARRGAVADRPLRASGRARGARPPAASRAAGRARRAGAHQRAAGAVNAEPLV